MKTWSLLLSDWVVFHVSQPYKKNWFNVGVENADIGVYG